MEGQIFSLKSEGYGFIKYKGINFYFHQSEFKGDFLSLQTAFIAADGKEQKLTVEFDNDETADRGPRAKNVRLKK